MIRNTQRFIAVASAVLLMFSFAACGGGGGGNGTTTVSLSGIVYNPVTDPDPTPVGGAMVGAYRFDDSTLIDSTTTAATGATGTFSLDVPKNVEIYLKAQKSGFISGNTRAGTLSSDETDVEVIILPEDNEVVLDVANRLYNKNESSWDSTLQQAGYIVMDAEAADESDLEGLTVTGENVDSASPLEVVYSSNLPDGSGTFISAPPTVARSDTNNLPLMGASANTAAGFGPYTLTGNLSVGTLDEAQIDAPLIQGEITYFTWYEQ